MDMEQQEIEEAKQQIIKETEFEELFWEIIKTSLENGELKPSDLYNK